MKMKGWIIVELDGKEVYRGESRSFVQNIGKILLAMFQSTASASLGTSGGVTSATITNTSGSSATIYGEWYGISTYYGVSGFAPMAVNAPAGTDSWGIVVGAGSTPQAYSDNKLANQIYNGTGSGQMSYGAHTTNSSYSSTSSYITISRTFTNQSGSAIVVREAGMIARNYGYDYSGVRLDVKYLIARDVLANPVTVNNLGTLTVTYKLTLSTS
jgi:hypothetical protein